MSGTLCYRSPVIFLLTSLFSAFTTPALAQEPAALEVPTPHLGTPSPHLEATSPEAEVPSANLGRAFLGGAAGFAVGLAGASLIGQGNQEALGLPGFLTVYAATGYGAARGASNSAYKVNPLGPMAMAVAVSFPAALLTFAVAEGSGDGGLVMAGVLMAGGPILGAALTATTIGNRRAKALRASVRPTVGATPEGQVGLGLRVRLPNH